MNNESPLVPQGSFLEQKNKGRARVKIAVFIVLAIHGVGLMALLMQGCQKAPDTTAKTTETPAVETNTVPQPVAPTFAEQTNIAPPAADTNVAQPATAQVQPQPVVTQQTSETAQPSATQPGTVTQHKIAKGETFAKLAKEYKVSVKAIQAANPGVDSSKLKIGQTIQIPAPAAMADTASKAAPAAATESAAANAGDTYKVQSGDTLTRIAGKHGTTVRAIRAANNLKTDHIKVGDVLKLPSKSANTAARNVTEPMTSAATSAPAGNGSLTR